MKALLVICLISLALSDIPIIPPDQEGGKPLMEVLNNRRSQRDFIHDSALTDRELSQLLYAAYGPNRPLGGLTVPSAVAGYPFDIYVFLESGTYIFDYPNSNLIEVNAQDLRKDTGTQEFCADANMNICLLGHYDRVTYAEGREEKERWMRLDSGYVTENVYLAAADLDLKAVVRAMFDQPTILQDLGLSADDIYIPLCMSVGH